MQYLKSFGVMGMLMATLLAAAQPQAVRPELLQTMWKAFWIAVPGESATDYGVYHFRKELNLEAKPASYVVHVSADNRYKLFVNEKMVSHGPARGDLTHWNFETVDLAPYLKAGKNILAAIVWNEGESRPEAQITYRTAFILQGNTIKEDSANTNNSWKGIRDKSYQPIQPQLVYSYYVSGPGEARDLRLQNEAWMQETFNDTGWESAQQLMNGLPKGVFDWQAGTWMLVPRPIPQMELTMQRLQALKKAEGIVVPDGFPAQQKRLTVPAHTTATLWLDQTYLTNAYPTLVFSGGKEAQLSLAYAEALYIDEGTDKDWRAQTQKGNRNEVAGKRFVGKEDRIISNGNNHQQFTPLWWRTFRYLQLKITTGNEPLTLTDIYSHFTGYPFQYKAAFDAGNPLFQNIIDVGWRTARLCANETYMDCPYYEQLQYVGDTRIQALISLYNSGDDRLMRYAINLIDQSRMAEGITLSRYPTAHAQQIPPFSLWWIGMLHDYWRYRPEADFIRQKLPGARQVLAFFNRYQEADGSLKNAPYWNFTDWSFERGMAPVGKGGNSAAMDLQLLLAYQTAAELEGTIGMNSFATLYKTEGEKLAHTIRKKYWNASKGLFADTPEKDLYSQHVNALALLTGLVQNTTATTLARKVTEDTSLTQASVYFKYYVHQALIKAGLGNDYMNWLGIWKENLDLGLTTWAEMSDVNRSRSDCHAWGSHPNIEFFRTVLGIDSDSPGFRTVKIEPRLGNLKKVSGRIPHPAGALAAAYNHENGKLQATITLPPNITGYLVWKGKRHPLKEGQTKLSL